jgi:hypothetical protein
MSPPALWRFTVMATGPLAPCPIRKRLGVAIGAWYACG